MCSYYGECVDVSGDFCGHCLDVREGRAEFTPDSGSGIGNNPPAQPLRAVNRISEAVSKATSQTVNQSSKSASKTIFGAAEDTIGLVVGGPWKGIRAGWKAGGKR